MALLDIRVWGYVAHQIGRFFLGRHDSAKELGFGEDHIPGEFTAFSTSLALFCVCHVTRSILFRAVLLALLVGVEGLGQHRRRR